MRLITIALTSLVVSILIVRLSNGNGRTAQFLNPNLNSSPPQD